MVSLEFLGFVAGFFSTMVYMPQVYKTWKTKSAKDISIEMFIINIVSVLLWITYGLISHKPPIYLTNMVVFTLSIIQITMILKYGKAAKAKN
ncbi:MAG: hypothetical protein LBT07_02570 [Endomicrobium sp.]|jgi:MtN3 and saliva related transmembrane protein|nr:hypothetical protein [Endomicrobium sp.]